MKATNIPFEEKRTLINSVQMYFQEERDEVIGDLAAENLLLFFIKELSPFLYNKALHDARAMIEQKMADLDEELYALEIPQRSKR